MQKANFISKLKIVNFFTKNYNIYFLAGLLTIGITLLMLSYRQPIDPDGINYLQAAKVFLSQGYKAASVAYNWPFYSILIAYTAKFTGLSLLISAWVLNTLLDILTILAFITLIKELNGSKNIQLVGMVIILTYSYFTHMFHHVMRDHGYYAFGLLSLVMLICYFRTFRWKYALGWAIAMLIASLFRIEAAILLIFLPLILLIKPKISFHKKIIYTLKAYTLHILLALVGVGYLVFIANHQSNLNQYSGRLPEFWHQIIFGLQTSWHTLNSKMPLMVKQMATYGSTTGWMPFAFGGLMGIYLAVLIGTLGYLYSAISIYALIKKTVPWDWSAKAVWVGTFILIGTTSLIFLSQQFFIVDRYIALLCFLLLLTVPFGLAKIYQDWRTHTASFTGTRWLFPILVFLVIATAIGGLGYFGPSKTYLIDAGDWIQQNTKITSKIYTNDNQFFFYANRPGLIDPDLQQNSKAIIHNFDYAILRIKKDCEPKECALINYFSIQPIKEFYNNRGNKILIYRLK